MACVIHRIKEFRKELKVGDVFWYMRSRYRAPYEIQGPCTILDFFKDARFGTCEVRYGWSGGDAQVIEEKSIRDLTNEWHGVFLNSADAYAYFEERKAIYRENPVYIAKHRDAVARAMSMEERRDLIDAL